MHTVAKIWVCCACTSVCAVYGIYACFCVCVPVSLDLLTRKSKRDISGAMITATIQILNFNIVFRQKEPENHEEME